MNNLLKTLMFKAGIIPTYVTANGYGHHTTLLSALSVLTPDAFDIVAKHGTDGTLTVVAATRQIS